MLEGPAFDSTSRSGTERSESMAAKTNTGNVIEKVSEAASKSKAESHFQAGMLKRYF